jgi:hypothetical protein
MLVCVCVFAGHSLLCVGRRYEWAVTGPDVSPVHNPLGRSYFIGL